MLQIQRSDLETGMRISLMKFSRCFITSSWGIAAYHCLKSSFRAGFTTICFEGEFWSGPFRWKLWSKHLKSKINSYDSLIWSRFHLLSSCFLLNMSKKHQKTSPMLSDPNPSSHPPILTSWSVSQSLGHSDRSVASITERNSTKWMEDWATPPVESVEKQQIRLESEKFMIWTRELGNSCSDTLIYLP